MELGTTVPRYADLLRDAAAALVAAGAGTPRLDAEVLLAAAMGRDRAGLYARLRDPVSGDTEARFRAALARRLRREPVAYITGVQEFWSLPIAVTPAVLIPRPETERLVEVACELLAPGSPLWKRGAGGDLQKSPLTPLLRRGEPAVSICDVGTGSGCIAVALARTIPHVRVVATDISPDALAVARANAAAHGVADRIELVCGDLFDPLGADRRFDVIVSNPPYVAEDDPVPPELAWEPSTALMAGADGLDVVRRLIAAAPARLRPGGWLVMEFGSAQAAAARALAAAAGFASHATRDDLAGLPRVLIAQRGADG